MKRPYSLLQVFTQDNLKLSGLLSEGSDFKTAYILVHGFTTNFYSHDFYHVIADSLKTEGKTFLLMETRGTGLHTEFLQKDGEGIFLGSYYEKIEDAHLDISAFIDYLSQQAYQDFVLIGHSLGTLKVVRYLFEGKFANKISKLLLLAPFDKNAFMERKAPGKWLDFLEVARNKIGDGKGNEIVPVPDFEDYPMTYNTFLSWYDQTDLNCIWDFYKNDYDFPLLRKIRIPVKVLIGDNDEYVTYPEFNVSSKKAMQLLEKHILDCETLIIPNCGHTYHGHEELLANEVVSF